MATVRALSRLLSADRRRAQDARNDQGRDASPHGAVLVLGNRNTTSQEEALKRIASLPALRQGKVLDIRRQITDGTYEVGDRLDQAINCLLEVLTGSPEESRLDGHGGSRPVKQVVG
jgi:anti-sigma28 factor (negative regulator of flagellin synthesis)